MENYEVNEDTLAIIPKNNKTIVYENHANYIINEECDKVMEDSCKYFGSTLQGRSEGSRDLLKTNYKVPILVEETSEMIFFPTTSPRLKDCAWISLKNIKSYERDSKGCKITFKNGKKIRLNISYGVINNQILRSSRLLILIKERKLAKLAKKTKK